jgi:transposase
MRNVAQKFEIVNNIFCPIDLHQNKMMIGIAVERGEAEFKVLDTDESSGVAQLISLLESYREHYLGSEVWVAYEASGSGFRLRDILVERGYRVAVLAPTHLPSSPKQRTQKTDKRDVLRILDVLRGHVLAGNHLPEVWVPDVQLRDDREIVRRCLDLKDELTRVKNKIHGLLRRYGIKRPESIKTLWTKKHLLWLRSVDSQLRDGAGVCLASLLREYDFYIQEMIKVERELVKLSEEERYARRVAALLEIPGVGLLTAMVFLTEMGDMDRFGNRRKVGGFVGLVPRCWESGEQTDRKGHISRMGPSRVRRMLGQAAWSHVRCDEAAGEWFKERTAGGKNKKKMIVAVMRRLAIVMWHRAQEAA